jgi:hypothetical protein
MNENEKYKIEDFWPDAEKMLDQHFESKKGFGFKFGLISLLVLMLSGITAWYFLSTTSREMNTLAVGTKTKIEVNASSSKRNTNLTSNTLNQSAKPNKIAEETKSNTLPKSTENTDKKSIENAEKKSTENIKTNLVLNLNKQKQAKTNEPGVSKTSEETKNTNAIGSLNNVNKTKTITPFLNGVGSSATTITADESSSKKGNLKTTFPKSNKTNRKENTLENGAITFNPINDNKVDSKTEFSKENSVLNSETKNEKYAASKKTAPRNKSINKQAPTNIASKESILINETVWLSPLKPKLSKQYSIPFTAQPIVLDQNFSFLSKTNKKPILSYQIGAGLFNVSKTLSASTNQDYIDRRNAEEKATNYVSWMFGAKIQYQRFAFNTGVELNKYGEKVTYSNWLLGSTSKITNSYNYSADSITTVSNYYIQGNQFDQTITQTTIDSTLISDTTTVYGQKSADVSGINSKTMISYIEIPLVIEYEAIKTKRFSVALRTGVSVGFISQKRGYYLDKTQEEFKDLNSITTFRSTVWNARIGADFSYFIVPKTSIFIRPEFRTNLQSIFKTEAGIQQKYRAFGVMIGLSKSF